MARRRTEPQRLTRAQWARYENVGLAPTLGLGDLVLNWTRRGIRDLDAKGALVGLSMERTIEGASTVTMTLRDPNGRVFGEPATAAGRWVDPAQQKVKQAYKREPVPVDEGWDPLLAPTTVGRAVEVELDGVTFRLVKMRYTASTAELELTFEDRIIYWLKRKRGTRRSPRAQVTRAEFVLALLREVATRNYRFVCPELHVRQAVDKPTGTTTRGATSSQSARQTAEPPSALDRVYPRHRIGTSGAARLSERQVRAAAELAGLSPTDALHAAQIAHGESDYYPGVVQDDPGDGMIGHGLWQMTPHAWGGPSSPNYRHMTSLGGINAMRNPIQAARQMAWMFKQSGNSWRQWYGTRYLNVGTRATGSVLKDGDTADLADTAEGKARTGGRWQSKRYQFSRNSDENSWTAIQRLAQEVGWRCFVVGNSVYYMSDEQLYGRRPRYQLRPGDPAVLEFACDLDWGKPVSEASLTVALDRWGAPPGSVILIDGYGPPDGRWLVTSVSRDWFAPSAEVTLKQPGKALLEPADERVQRSSAATSAGGAASGSSSKSEQVYAMARAIGERHHPYVWGGGHARCGTPDRGTGRDPGIGYDCSGYVCACLAAAGLGFRKGSPGTNSTGLTSWGEPGRGREFTVYANAQHTWIQFHGLGSGKRADTSPYGDTQGRGPRLRTTERSDQGAFTARHWSGC